MPGRPMKIVRFTSKQHVTMQRVKREIQPAQPVWCMTTENGSWVMRQGDVITITGNCLYGWLYGASPRKTGETASHPIARAKRVGTEIQRRWLATFPKLAELLEKLQKAAKRDGRIIAIDGRVIPLRSPHAALNTLLQSCGSIIVKTATVWAAAEIKRLGLNAVMVIHMHDEKQDDCATEADAWAAGAAFVGGIKHAEAKFKFRCPLNGDTSVGRNWAETH